MASSKYDRVETMEAGLTPLELKSVGPVKSQSLDERDDMKRVFILCALTASAVTVALSLFLLVSSLSDQLQPKAGPQTVGAFVIRYDDEILAVRHEGPQGSVSWGLPTVHHDTKQLLQFMQRTSKDIALKDNTGSVSTPGYHCLDSPVEPYQEICVVRAASRQVQISPSDMNSHQWKSSKELMSGLKLDKSLESLLKDKSNRQQLATGFQLTDLESLGLPFGSKVKKLGAGLFLKAEGDILLLRRNSSHNNATLSVPGGNVDFDDQHLRATAEREAVEEMGACPEYEYKGEIDTRRGKHDEKMFKMYLGEMPSELRYSFRAVLDHESLDWGWFPLKTLHERDDLHPTVRILARDHAKKVKEIFSE